MHKEMNDISSGKSNTEAVPTIIIEPIAKDSTWQVPPDCQITLPLARLLKLVPRFTKIVAAIFSKGELRVVHINFTNSTQGPAIMDEHNLVVKVIIKGKEVPGSIINKGSRVNVISKVTCDHHGIQEWEVCLFWLWMTDTTSIRPLGLIKNLELSMGGYPFQHFHGRIKIGCIRSISTPIGPTLVMSNQH